MKEYLEKIRNIAREMLIRPGGVDVETWRRIWGMARAALRELEERENDEER